MTKIPVLPVATNIYIFSFWNSSRVKSDLFTLSDLYMERIGLKHYIWSDTAKEGSVFKNLTRGATFLVAGAEWELQVIKTISCNESKMLSKFLQKTNIDFVDGMEINSNTILWKKNSQKSLKWTRNNQNMVALWNLLKLEWSWKMFSLNLFYFKLRI